MEFRGKWNISEDQKRFFDKEPIIKKNTICEPSVRKSFVRNENVV